MEFKSKFGARALVSVAMIAGFLLLAQNAYGTEGKPSSKATGTGCCAGAQTGKVDYDFDYPEEGCDPVRFLQARYLIEECNDFMSKAKPLHEKMQEQILIAKTLKGEANMMMNKMPPVVPPTLKGKALEDATKQYTADLQKFVLNVEKYRANLQTFRTTIGECQRAQNAYERQRGLYDLHCNQFHVSGLAQVEAPHICGELNMSQAEAGQVAGLLRADQQRLQKTLQDAQTTNALVNESRALVASNLTATVQESVRQREEEKLAREFGRIKEEYELLNIQSKMLGSEKQKQAGALVRTTTVSGKVTPGK